MKPREIKFRGKKDKTGEWIVGNLHIPNKLFTSSYICPDTLYGDVAPGYDEEYETFEEAVSHGAAIGFYHPIISETIGQFTGLIDKNGKEVFEKDILDISKFEGSSIYRMVINDIMQMPNELYGSNVDWYEVIGNTIDNIDLLKID